MQSRLFLLLSMLLLVVFSAKTNLPGVEKQITEDNTYPANPAPEEEPKLPEGTSLDTPEDDGTGTSTLSGSGLLTYLSEFLR